MSEKKRISAKQIVLIGVLALLVGAFIAFGDSVHILWLAVAENRALLKVEVADNIALAMLAFGAIYALGVVVVPPSGSVLTILGGFLFGQWLGTPVVVVAATLGGTILFLIARGALHDLLAEKAGPWLGKMREGFQENALSYLLFLRLVPLFPFFVVNIAPAFLGVRLGTYVLATFVGIIPGTFAYVAIGTGLDSILEAPYQAYLGCVDQGGADCKVSVNLGDLVTREIIIALVALSLVMLIPPVLKKLRKQKVEA